MQSSFWKDFLQFLEINADKYKIVMNIIQQSDAKVEKNKIVTVLCHNKGVKIYLDTRITALESALFDFSQVQYKVKIVIQEGKRTKKDEAPLLEFKPSVEDLFTKAGLNPKYSFDNFAVSSSNQVAYAAAQAVAQSPGTAYTPLFLYGGVGVGKTHLAQSIARYVLEKDTDKKVFFCPGDQFLNEFVDSIREKSGARFRKKYRSYNFLILDDVQFISGKEKVQEELFHTFNEIISHKGQIILTSDRPPAQIKDLEDRLRSRFSGGLTVDINEPGFELRTAIILIKAQEKNIEINIKASELIAEYIEDTRALEGTLLSVYAKIAGVKSKIEEDDVKNYFGEKKDEKVVKELSPNDIIKAVCIYYNIKQSQVKSPTRVEHIALARQVTMYLLIKELHMNLLDVAFFLKRRDHTTAIHGRDKIDHLMMTDQKFKDQIDTIVKSLHSST